MPTLGDDVVVLAKRRSAGGHHACEYEFNLGSNNNVRFSGGARM